MAKNYGVKDFFGDILAGMAGITPLYEAQAAGMPEAAGTSPEVFQALMGQRMTPLEQRYKEAQIRGLEEEIPISRQYKEAQIAEKKERAEELKSRTLRNKLMTNTLLKKWESSKDPKEKFVYDSLLQMQRTPGFQYGAIDIPESVNSLEQMYDLAENKGLFGKTPSKPPAKKGFMPKTLDELKNARIANQIDDMQFMEIAKQKGWAE